MTDDYPPFRRMDEEGYGDDRPMGFGSLTRMRTQLGSLRNFPDPASFVERRNADGEYAQLYAATWRTLAYHPRRAPKGATGIKVDINIAAGPGATLPAGEICLAVRVDGITYTSDVQEVTAESGEPRPYTLEATGFRLRREGWIEVAVVGRSYVANILEERGFDTTGEYFHAREDSTEDDYGAGVGIDPGNVSQRADLVQKIGEEATGEFDDDGDPIVTPIYALSHPDLVGRNISGDVVELFWMQMPQGYEARIVFDGEFPVSKNALRPNIIPRSDRGPGHLQRSAEEILVRPRTYNVGTPYPDRPDDSWQRRPRRHEHTASDPLTLKWATSLLNADVRLRVNLGIIGINLNKSVFGANVGSEIVEDSCSATIDLYHPADGVVISEEHEIRALHWPLTRSGDPPYLFERWIAEEETLNGWTYRADQVYMGTGDAPSWGDLRLVSVQTLTLDLTADNFNDAGLSTTMGVGVHVNLGDGDTSLESQHVMVVVGSSLQQSILDA